MTITMRIAVNITTTSQSIPLLLMFFLSGCVTIIISARGKHLIALSAILCLEGQPLHRDFFYLLNGRFIPLTLRRHD